MGVVKNLFGGGGDAPAPLPMPMAPPVAPPAYAAPNEGAAGNLSPGAKAAGAFSDTIITGPEGLKKKEPTAAPALKSTLGA